MPESGTQMEGHGGQTAGWSSWADMGDWSSYVPPEDRPSADLDPDVARVAGVYDCLLGGRDNYPADRAVVDAAVEVFPSLWVAARENRAFMRRVTRFCAEAGVDQFLDIGAGMPMSPNLHEIAQEIVPAARVVYVDNDRLVVTHGRALLASGPDGRVACVAADLRDPQTILGAVRDTLDVGRPVAVSLLGILDLVGDEDDPGCLIGELLAALAPGSYLAVTHFTADFAPDPVADLVDVVGECAGIWICPRGRSEVGRFFTGLDLVDPGVVPVQRWRPDVPASGLPTDAAVSCYAGLARMRR
jgi:SAM-dependent methyltransferase